MGRKHETSFRLVLTDSKNSTKSGRFKEILGSFDPRKSTEAFDVERIKYWIGQGIKPTGSVHNLFVTHKIIDAKKINVLPKKTPIVKEAEKVEEVKEEIKAEEPKAEVKEEALAPAEEAPVAETPAPEPIAETPAESAPVVE